MASKRHENNAVRRILDGQTIDFGNSMKKIKNINSIPLL